jgi:hypothetical protein
MNKDEIEEARQQAQAYCYQVYDDPDVYTANVVGGHGGMHCLENGDGPHLHEIPQERIEQAYQANQSNTDLGWTVENAKSHDSEKPDEIPLLGIHLSELGMLALVALGILALVTTIGLVQRYRDGSS